MNFADNIFCLKMSLAFLLFLLDELMQFKMSCVYLDSWRYCKWLSSNLMHLLKHSYQVSWICVWIKCIQFSQRSVLTSFLIYLYVFIAQFSPFEIILWSHGHNIRLLHNLNWHSFNYINYPWEKTFVISQESERSLLWFWPDSFECTLRKGNDERWCDWTSTFV